MRLTTHSDYALRVLLYLGTQPAGAVVTIGTIAEAYGISHNHLVKVIQTLRDCGDVETVRGKSGGLRLARAPEDIRIGDVVRATEPDFNLVECFSSEADACAISGACRLTNVLAKANRAFLATLDDHSLADLLGNRKALLKRLGGEAPASKLTA